MSSTEGAEPSGRGKVSKPLDRAWEHATPIPGVPHGSKCIYCGQVIKSGGVTRLKQHLGWVGSNVRNCSKVPKSVRAEMKESLQASASGKKAHKTQEKEVAATMGGYEIDSDSDDEGDVEAHQMRRAMEESRAMAWEREQRERGMMGGRHSFHQSSHEYGAGSSHGARVYKREGMTAGTGRKKKGPIEKMFARTASMRGAPHQLYEGVGGVQKKMTHMFSKGKDKVKQLGESVAAFFIHGAVPAHLAESVPFKNMIHTAQQVGPGVDPPSSY